VKTPCRRSQADRILAIHCETAIASGAGSRGVEPSNFRRCIDIGWSMVLSAMPAIQGAAGLSSHQRSLVQILGDWLHDHTLRPTISEA